MKAYAAQVNEIATMTLNGQIDLEKARVYASLSRTIAQLVSVEVTRARFLQTEPDLSLKMERDEDG